MTELIDNLKLLKRPRLGAVPTVFEEHARNHTELKILLSLKNSGVSHLPGQAFDISFHIQECNRRLRQTSHRLRVHQTKTSGH